MEDLINQVDRSIDALVLSGANSVFATLTTPSATLLVLIAGVSLALFAARSAFRRSMAVDDFLMFVARFSLIYSLVSGGALWTTYVYPFISGFGDAVGATILNGFTLGVYSSDGIVGSMAEYVQLNFLAVTAAYNVVSLSSLADGSGFGILVFGFIAFVAVLIMAGIALAFIIISKMFLGILIAVTPVFLVGMFLKSTSDIANGWVRGVSIILVFQVLVYGVLGLTLGATVGVLQVTLAALENIDIASPANISGGLANLSLATGLSIICLFLCPMFARAVGGANIGFGENKIGAAASTAAAAAAATVSNLARSNSSDPISSASNAQGAASSSTQTSTPDYKQADRDRGRATAARHANALRR